MNSNENEVLSPMTTARGVEKLLAYGLMQGLLGAEDCYEARNRLLDIFGLEEAYPERAALGLPTDAIRAEVEALKDGLTPESILDPMFAEAAERGIIPENLTTYRDLLDAKAMGALLPRPSEFNRIFREKYAEDREQATDFYYHIARASHYIMTERIAKNLYWKAPTRYGELEITVNLSKPEKDPREIAKLKFAKASSYPACMLCPENTGYAGRLNHPARQNLRQLPLRLQGEDWFMQYSPYVYYNEHCIVLKAEHIPMKVSPLTFRRLFDFVDIFPHYFLGSNAGLPVVGGSILNHEHYQGGRHRFPMEFAAVRGEYTDPEFPNVTVKSLVWPLTTVRIAGDKRAEVEAVADKIFAAWDVYSNPALGIFAETEENGVKAPHNAITPIARKNERGQYELDLSLRNNIQTEQYPDGVFHPHPEYHHIKKENIGLIEVMGLAVLPGRLEKELGLIAEILTGKRTEAEMSDEEQLSIAKHHPWIDELIWNHGTALGAEEADKLLKSEVGRIFGEVLACCGVFPETEEGEAALDGFLTGAGLSAKA